MSLDYLAHFVAALFLVNGIPHFVQGVCGNPFQTPFAKPPGVGESPPITNVLWGSANLVTGYALLFGIGDFRVGANLDTLLTGLGALLAAMTLAWHFGKVRR